MSKKFYSLLSLIFLLNLLVKPVYILAIEVSVQNVVGTLEYGIYFVLLNSAYLFQIVNDFGINIYTNRRVARDTSSFLSVLPGMVRIKLLLSLAFFACLIGFAAIAGYLDRIDLLIPIGINMVLVSLVLFLRAGVSGLGMYRADSVLSILDKFLMIVICGYLLFFWSGNFTIYHFVYAQTASLIATASVAVFVLAGKSQLRASGSDGESTLALLKNSWPFALSVFLMGIYTRIDGVMIEAFAPDGRFQAGVYAAGYRLLDASNMMAYLFAVLLLPMFSRLHDNRAELTRLLSQAFRAMLVLTLTVSVLCFFYRMEIMDWLYIQATPEWGRIFGVLILSFCAIGMMYVFGTYLTAIEDIRKLNIVYLVCVGLNVVMNYFLIRRYGAYGAAIATLATQSVATLAFILLTGRSLRLKMSISLAFKILVFIAGGFGIIYCLQYILPRSWWIAGMIAGTAAVIIFALLMRFIDYRELKSAISAPSTPG